MRGARGRGRHALFLAYAHGDMRHPQDARGGSSDSAVQNQITFYIGDYLNRAREN
jgi:hypothetical protein